MFPLVLLFFYIPLELKNYILIIYRCILGELIGLFRFGGEVHTGTHLLRFSRVTNTWQSFVAPSKSLSFLNLI